MFEPVQQQAPVTKDFPMEERATPYNRPLALPGAANPGMSAANVEIINQQFKLISENFAGLDKTLTALGVNVRKAIDEDIGKLKNELRRELADAIVKAQNELRIEDAEIINKLLVANGLKGKVDVDK